MQVRVYCRGDKACWSGVSLICGSPIVFFSILAMMSIRPRQSFFVSIFLHRSVRVGLKVCKRSISFPSSCYALVDLIKLKILPSLYSSTCVMPVTLVWVSKQPLHTHCQYMFCNKKGQLVINAPVPKIFIFSKDSYTIIVQPLDSFHHTARWILWYYHRYYNNHCATLRTFSIQSIDSIDVAGIRVL